MKKQEKVAIIYPDVPDFAENIQALSTPDEFERVDIVVPAAGNRAAAYQKAMESSDAPYKIYILNYSTSKGSGLSIPCHN